MEINIAQLQQILYIPSIGSRRGWNCVSAFTVAKRTAKTQGNYRDGASDCLLKASVEI